MSNLVANPSFETTGSWTKGGTTGNVTFPSTAVAGFDGPSCCQVLESGGNCYLYQDVPVNPSTQYTLSAYVQIASWVAGGMFLKAANSSFSTYSSATSSQANQGWTRISTTFTTDPDVTSIRVLLDTYNGASLTGYWDAVMLSPGGLTAFDPPFGGAAPRSDQFFAAF